MLGITYDYEGHQFQWDVSTQYKWVILWSHIYTWFFSEFWFSEVGAGRVSRSDLAAGYCQFVERLIKISIILICVNDFSGVSSLGKASYVITLTPYFVLTALLAYAAPREVLNIKYDGEVVLWYINHHPPLTQGALDGMKQLFEPEWEKMGNYDVSWFALSNNHLNILLLVPRFGAPLHLRYFSRSLLVTVASWRSPVTTSSTTTAPGTPS